MKAVDADETMRTSVQALMGRSSADAPTPLPEACQRRADTLRQYAEAKGYQGRQRDDSVLARMLAYDCWAAHEFPAVVIADAADVALSRPDLADRVWHHTAGAAILATPICECPHPAYHRDQLIAIAHELNGDL